MASPTRSSNHRASFAALCGLASLAALPVAVVLARQTQGVSLLGAAWGIPVGFAAGVAALLFARGARGAYARALERAGGARRIRAARILAVAGISLALAGAIAVGFYELLLRLEG